MCLCDDKYFKVTDITTKKIKLYKRADSIARRFDTDKDWVFICLERGRHLTYKGGLYKVEVNKHAECQLLRAKIRKYFKHNPSFLSEERIRRYKIRIEEIERSEVNEAERSEQGDRSD